MSDDWTDNLKPLDLAAIGTIDGCADDPLSVDALESEMDILPHLDGDRRQETKGIDRETRDARQATLATAAIGHIPGPRQAIHAIVSGRFSLWDLVPATLNLAAPATIVNLHIATLGFSKANIDALCELLDAGQIGAVRLLASHYFKGTSGPIYDHALAAFARYPVRAVFMSLRTHAKLLLIALSDGRTLTVESSANLRSCKNIEQMTLSDPAVYQFHREWIESLFAQATRQGAA